MWSVAWKMNVVAPPLDTRTRSSVRSDSWPFWTSPNVIAYFGPSPELGM